MNKKPNKSYDRVMSRVYKDSRSSLKSNPIVTRHESCSSARVSAKPLASNVSSSVFSELPTVLNNYVPETVEKKVVRPSVMSSKVVKPRRTLNSLDTSKSPPRMGRAGKARSLSAQGSVPVVRRDEGWSETHLRECYSSRSHTRLKELKDEIKSYHETEKKMRLRSQLYKKCGIVFDEDGYLAKDKAVQVEAHTEIEPEVLR